MHKSVPNGEGERLSKRVMAMHGCSRSEAERLIESGYVQVNRVTAEEPARRVGLETVTVNAPTLSETLLPVTLLWHKPAGVPLVADQVLAGLLAASADLRPWHLKHLRCVSPLPEAASGLAVFEQDPRALRHWRDKGPLLEHEWMLDVAGAAPAEQLQALQQHTRLLSAGQGTPWLKLSISSQNAERTRLRLVVKGYTPEQLPQWLHHAGLPALGMHRLRVGRLALGALPLSAFRLLGERERV